MKAEKIEKIYATSTEKVIAITDFSYTFKKGNFYAIMGHSGSGKSTLLRIIGLMDQMTSGSLEIDGENVVNLNDTTASEIRKEKIGFVFQDYFLDKNLRAIENVILPMLINKKIKKDERIKRATELLKMVGLEDKINSYPKELSGGEQQRVCLARALANNPDYILCDEPTGNLDEENEKKILTMLKNLSNQRKCIIVFSHRKKKKKYADDIINLKGGKLVS